MMKLRYLFGIPYLFFFGMMGGDIIYDALVIGVLAGFTDIIREGGNGPRFGGLIFLVTPKKNLTSCHVNVIL